MRSGFTSMLTGSHDSRMRIQRPRLLIVLCALTAVGFCAGILVRSPTSDAGGAATTSITPVWGPSSARVPSDLPAPTNLRSNPAAQKSGPPEPVAQRTATTAAESAAKAAADLASK